MPPTATTQLRHDAGGLLTPMLQGMEPCNSQSSSLGVTRDAEDSTVVPEGGLHALRHYRAHPADGSVERRTMIFPEGERL